MFLSSLNNSWITHLAGFYKFESSQGVHLTSMNALAKINKQRTEKKRKRSCMKFCNGKARLWRNHRSCSQALSYQTLSTAIILARARVENWLLYLLQDITARW